MQGLIVNAVKTAYSQHTRLANGIDHLLLLDNSRLAADDLVDFIDHHLKTLDQHETRPLILLVELRQTGMPPLAYLSRTYQDMLKTHPTDRFHARIAYLYLGGFVMPIVASFFRLIRNASHVERRFYNVKDRAEAEEWLLTGHSDS